MGPQLRRTALVAALTFALDRASKIWVIESLNLPQRLHIPVWDPYLNYSMAWNEGINFGLFNLGAEGRWILVALAVVICVGLLVWVRRTGTWAAAIGTGLILGGAAGNVWDRVRYGAVADFINMSCCGIRNPFAFNIADAAIFGGAAVLILFHRPEAKPARRRRSR